MPTIEKDTVVYPTTTTSDGGATAAVIIVSLLIVAVLGWMIYAFSTSQPATSTLIERNTINNTTPVPLPTPVPTPVAPPSDTNIIVPDNTPSAPSTPAPSTP